METRINQPNEAIETWGDVGVQLRRAADRAMPKKLPAYWGETRWYKFPHPCLTAHLHKTYIRLMVSPHGDYDQGRILAPSCEVLYWYVASKDDNNDTV